jgi:hypothetical protein
MPKPPVELEPRMVKLQAAAKIRMGKPPAVVGKNN